VSQGFIVAVLMNLVMLVAIVLLFIGPTRRHLRRFLPAPGQGPSPAQRARSHIRNRYFAQTSQPHKRIAVTISGGDPGYSETAKMISEAAIHLATATHKLPGGILTASSALGFAYVERLQNAGMTFKVETLDV
jgi:saccharopine dehydrogenase (NAD+, L-glutamate forming)